MVVESGGDLLLCRGSPLPLPLGTDRAVRLTADPVPEFFAACRKMLADAREEAISVPRGGRMSRLAVVAIAFAMLELPDACIATRDSRHVDR